tara:strand:+ start:72 stop:314 length:243 start_codon:yes stop_codon:yes gene_type:complete
MYPDYKNKGQSVQENISFLVALPLFLKAFECSKLGTLPLIWNTFGVFEKYSRNWGKKFTNAFLGEKTSIQIVMTQNYVIN